jgi:nucleotide-binding universal stress UspA family protein
MPKGGLSFPADAHIATAIEDSGNIILLTTRPSSGITQIGSVPVAVLAHGPTDRGGKTCQGRAVE